MRIADISFISADARFELVIEPIAVKVLRAFPLAFVNSRHVETLLAVSNKLITNVKIPGSLR